jgi:hypothetical protein
MLIIKQKFWEIIVREETLWQTYTLLTKKEIGM